MSASMPGVASLIALCQLCPGHEWGSVRRDSGPCGFEGPSPQSRSPPSPGQRHSHHWAQSLFTPWHTETRKLLVLPSGAGGGRGQSSMTTQGSSPPGPALLLRVGGGDSLSSAWNPSMPGQLGSSALNHAPDIRPFRELLIQITSFPHRLQARHWAGNLSCPCSLSFCLAVTHGSLSIQAPVGDRSQSRPSSHSASESSHPQALLCPRVLIITAITH